MINRPVKAGGALSSEIVITRTLTIFKTVMKLASVATIVHMQNDERRNVPLQHRKYPVKLNTNLESTFAVTFYVQYLLALHQYIYFVHALYPLQKTHEYHTLYPDFLFLIFMA